MFDDVPHIFCLFLMAVWCPGMAITISVQYNGGLHDIILLTQCYSSGNPFKCHEEVLWLQPMIPPKLIFFYLTGGCSAEGLGAFRICF